MIFNVVLWHIFPSIKRDSEPFLSKRGRIWQPSTYLCKTSQNVVLTLQSKGDIAVLPNLYHFEKVWHVQIEVGSATCSASDSKPLLPSSVTLWMAAKGFTEMMDWTLAVPSVIKHSNNSLPLVRQLKGRKGLCRHSQHIYSRSNSARAQNVWKSHSTK